jgi:DNA polymerase III subunit alpha, Gram-positive type
MKYNNRFVVCDTETGGLPNKDKSATIDVALTEIAYATIDCESLEIIGSGSWLIKPYADGLEYNPQAAQVSGISRQMCEKEGLPIEQVHKEFVKMLIDNKVGKLLPIMVFQNKSFDIPFLENMFLLMNDDFNKYIERTEDTLHWARMKFIEKPNFKLGSIAEYLNIDLVNAHRALVDTMATAQIWISFMKSLRDSGSKQSLQENSFRKGFKF